MQFEHSQVLKTMSDEELEAAIEYVRGMLAARAGDEAKVIEGAAEPIALPAPDVVTDGGARRPNKLMAAADAAIAPRKRRPRKREVPSPPVA
jgi:hypothetical protein